MAKREIKFWKIVGGYTYCIKWRGRWHYVGNGLRAGTYVNTMLKAQGYTLYRVQGTPAKIEALWAEHGCTLATLKKNLPHFDALTAL